MKIVFRVDASLSIGSGHVFRCLNLAGALRKNGFECIFLTKEHAGNLIQYIKTYLFQVYVISKEDNVDDKYIENEKEWLGGSQKEDAEKTCEIIYRNNFAPGIFIIDHYSLDSEWESLIKWKFPSTKIVVIDDLCNRKHYCDILIDSTFERTSEEYRILVPEYCTILAGTDYALLKDEFLQLRKEAILKRTSILSPQKILITMGGVDIHNVTGKVLKELNNRADLHYKKITVVLGVNCPHKKNIENIAQSIKYDVDIKVNTNNMPQLMLEHDLSIGALGSTTWERAVLGLPTVNIAIADNQLVIVEKLRRNGFIVFDSINFTGAELARSLIKLTDFYDEMVSRSLSICDGRGLQRTLKFIMSLSTNK